MIVTNFTHCDLDGIGCAVLLKSQADKENNEFDYEVCSHNGDNEINLIINNYLDLVGIDNDRDVYITDIGVNKDTADRIDGLYKQGFKVTLLDHHISNDWLNRYEWATVITEYDGVNTCGTSLVYNKVFKHHNKFFDHFVEIVRLRDNAEWLTQKDKLSVEDVEHCILMNDVMYNNGYDNFISRILDVEMALDGNDFATSNLYSQSEYKSFVIKREEYENYKKDRINDATKIEAGVIDEYSYIITFANHDVSELGNNMCTETGYDVAMMINIDRKCVEIRSVKDNVDVSKIAIRMGGGGHFHASGFSITNNMNEKMIENFINLTLRRKDS